MGGAAVFAGILLIAFVIWLAFNGNTPDTAEEQIDGRSGEVVTE